MAAWRRAEDIRREWLRRGLCTEPAERTAAEDALTRIYARIGRPRPRFVWVDSPKAAAPLVVGLPGHDDLYQWITGPRPNGAPPLASDLAAAVSGLRGALDDCATKPAFDRPPKRKPGEKWPVLPAPQAISAGIPFREVLRQGVRDALRTSLANGCYLPVRAALGTGGRVPVCWYGHQESSWIAYYDVYRRLGLACYQSHDEAQLDDWASLARTSGWWWPDEQVCVVAERPAIIRAEPLPHAWYEEIRLANTTGPAIEYRDGWSV